MPVGARVYTHCNTGSLATVGYGTALGVVRAAAEAGKRPSVWVGETRPLLQGARLTAWELDRLGIDGTIVVDGAAATLMAQGLVDVVLVGADRIATNGDVVNKIGTYGLAVLARQHGVPFVVAAPTSTIDPAPPNGDMVNIEVRDPEESPSVQGRRSRRPGSRPTTRRSTGHRPPRVGHRHRAGHRARSVPPLARRPSAQGRALDLPDPGGRSPGASAQRRTRTATWFDVSQSRP